MKKMNHEPGEIIQWERWERESVRWV